MAREIKFRGYHSEDKVMVYKLNSLKLFDGVLKVDDYILMQFTGLQDKNGKDIYEGDILLLEDNWAKITECDRKHVLIKFHEGAFMYGRGFDPYHMNTYLWMGAQSKHVEVIGNLYEHPELLGNSNG